MPWRPQFHFNGVQGWFLEPCGGSLYDLVGNCVWGPCPRGLSRYPVEVTRNGDVRVNVAPELIIRGTAGYIDKPVTR